jgi:hypothetical protein
MVRAACRIFSFSRSPKTAFYYPEPPISQGKEYVFLLFLLAGCAATPALCLVRNRLSESMFTCEVIQRVNKTAFRSHLRRAYEVLEVFVLVIEHWIYI